MSVQNIPRFNGHPVLEKMPAPCLFMTEGGFNVRIPLPYEKSENGVADIYVHRGCVEYWANRYIDAVYDVLLIDKTYKLYYPVKNLRTGLYDILGEDVEHSVEEIYDMAMRAKKNYLSHPIKLPKPKRNSMQRYNLPEDWALVHPDNMITPEYVKEYNIPRFW